MGPTIFPESTKLRQPLSLEEDKPRQDQGQQAFWTERQPKVAEFGPVHIQRLEKLPQKLLPANNESLIDSGIFSSIGNPPAEVPSQTQKAGAVQVGICLYDKDSNKPKTTAARKSTKAEEHKKAQRSRSEQRKDQLAVEKEIVSGLWLKIGMCKRDNRPRETPSRDPRWLKEGNRRDGHVQTVLGAQKR